MLKKTDLAQVQQQLGKLANEDLSSLSRKELAQLEKILTKARQPVGLQVKTWRAVVENPEVTPAELLQKFHREGRTEAKLSSIRSFVYHARGTLMALARKTPQEALAVLRQLGQREE
jgi:hypothetical protein